MKDLGLVRKVPIQWRGRDTSRILSGSAAETYTVDIIWDEEVVPHHHSVYNKKDDDTSKRNSRNTCKAARYLHGY
jgi:hypothetical protein